MSALPALSNHPRPLVEIRLDQGLGRHRLAKKAGVSISTLYSIEKGGHRMMPETARLIADALGVDPLDIEEYAVQRREESRRPGYR